MTTETLVIGIISNYSWSWKDNSLLSIWCRLVPEKAAVLVTMFGHIQPGPQDPMFILKQRADSDVDPEKVDLGVGIYRSEAGSYQELEVVKLVSHPCSSSIC